VLGLTVPLELPHSQSQLDEDTDDYDQLPEINDHEMVISDAEDRFELFLLIPSSVWS